MWWFLLSDWFGGPPYAWAVAVGMFAGILMGIALLYHLETEYQRKWGGPRMDAKNRAHKRSRNAPDEVGCIRIPPSLKLSTILLIALTLGMGTVSATTFTFTTTADFDIGTKAPTTNGNLGIETTTDNPGIVSGSFELGSLKGDAFNTADADANTAKWSPFEFETLTGCSVSSTQVIAAGVLTLTANRNIAPLGVCAEGVFSDSTLSGVLTTTWKVDAVTIAATGNFVYAALVNQQLGACGFGATEDGIQYLLVKGTDANTFSLTAQTCTDGSTATVGSATDNIAEPTWVRMTRSGTTVTWFYSTNGIDFTQDETTTFSTSSSLYVGLNAYDTNDDSTALVINGDDFRMSAGTVDSGGFRTAGQWTSAIQLDLPASEVFTSAVVTFSGASASNYITSFTLLNALGDPLFFDDTDVTGGTTKEYTIPSVESGGTWRVRLNLTGGGAGTPTITEIVINTTAPPTPPVECFGTSVFGSILFVLFGIVSGVAIALGVYYAVTSEAGELNWFALSASIIGLIVLLGIVGILLGVFQTGATVGC